MIGQGTRRLFPRLPYAIKGAGNLRTACEPSEHYSTRSRIPIMNPDTKPENPISAINLWENFWVFSAYGIFIGAGTGVMSLFDMDLAWPRKLMLEPLSYYSFMLLSIVGLAGLAIINITTARTALEMHASRLVRRVFVPISNAGLCCGAIISGTMLGVALGLSPWFLYDQAAASIVRLSFLVAAYFIAVLVPLAMMKRSMFDLSKEDERVTSIVGAIYCIVVGVAYWQINQEIFWKVVLTVLLLGSLVSTVIWRIHRTKRGLGVQSPD